MAAPIDQSVPEGPLVAVAAGGPPLDRLAELAESMPTGEWRARSDAAQAVACYLACHPRVAAVRYPGLTSDPDYQRASSALRRGFGPWVDVCLAGAKKPGWLRLDVTDADAPAWVCRLEALLAER
ncbi:MAG: PLP-dependent transferase [Atopobiaceae bacterium]|uniref:PLP-dependent transferase n=1 Tax=Paratractidigestivibacter faecalis TaxID=2292441 RepID=UPI003A3B6BEE